MNAKTGFAYLLVLFAVTGICLSLFHQDGAMVPSHTKPGNIHIHGTWPHVTGFTETDVSIRTVGTGPLRVHFIQANNPTPSAVSVKLVLDGHEVFNQQICDLDPLQAGKIVIHRVNGNRPHHVLAKYTFKQAESDIAGAPTGSDTD
ncbi:hypothetical protein PTTG_27969 [Puccinia triticina 1-1 BBBD Race 1]|uniref:Uncharacterized protein n=2 Tax=Puccinia triticina TaxID=208348 RepID=A0A180GGC4_PUCT1|nr:hypothetical protein PTTG_27969 [Puccinia triticina 1-1 BBBD Race 1]WAR53847.1 hypothetical protein PtB15_3B356 [Puccinia triticina]